MSPESLTDLLIIGAGPSGLVAAAWASRYKLRARIIDDKADRISKGRADGLHVRTLEILDSFNAASKILKQAVPIREICSWDSDPDNIESIKCNQRVQSKEEELGRFPQVVLHQGAIEQALLDCLADEGHLTIERSVKTQSLKVDLEGYREYPVSVQTSEELIHAKYVIACDGGHSWTRRQIGMSVDRSRTERHFGVIDFMPRSNFPDIRVSCAIHSVAGVLMTVPRENDLVRFYVKLDGKNTTAEKIIERASKALHPYTLEASYVDWWSVYTIAHQCAKELDYAQRVFLVGDAAHTHSPTMGAGMNVSMQDAHNLVWKIAMVLDGLAKPELLRTYHLERHKVAEELIEADKVVADFYWEGRREDRDDFEKFRDQFSTIMTGVGIRYTPSILTDATGVSKTIVGQRIPSHVLSHKGKKVHLHSLVGSDGRWRVVVCLRNVDRIKPVWKQLYHIMRTYTPSGLAPDSVIQVIDVRTSSCTETVDFVEQCQPLLCKTDDDEFYDALGVASGTGSLVIVRPDQHVGLIVDYDDIEALKAYFNRVLIPQFAN